MSQRLHITLNGEPLELPAPTSIETLVADQGLAGRRIAVEVNRHIVPRSQHADHQLQEDDVVEIVHAIGGG